MGKPAKSPPPGWRLTADGGWTRHEGPPKPPPSRRCEYRYRDDEEKSGRCWAWRVNDTDFCHAHGPNSAQWHSKGGIQKAVNEKAFWAERERLAADLEKAKTWEGYSTLVRAAIREQYDKGASAKDIAAYMQRLEKALEHTAKDESGGAPSEIILGDPDGRGL
jgi:hypothetical protein